MDTATFIEVLESHEIPTQSIYEDLSEIGKVLWHDDNLTIKIVCAIEGHPRVSLVGLGPDDQYHFLEADLGGFSGSEVSELVSHVKEHSVKIFQSAVQAGEFLCISVSGNESNSRRFKAPPTNDFVNENAFKSAELLGVDVPTETAVQNALPKEFKKVN